MEAEDLISNRCQGSLDVFLVGVNDGIIFYPHLQCSFIAFVVGWADHLEPDVGRVDLVSSEDDDAFRDDNAVDDYLFIMTTKRFAEHILGNHC